MKLLWEPEDVKVGRWVCKNESKTNGISGLWDAKWTKIIGYVNFSTGQNGDENFVLISVADGMVESAKTRSEMVEYLNENGMSPMNMNMVSTILKLIKTSVEGEGRNEKA